MKKTIGIIGFPQDIGASRRGVDMGPYALRAEGLITAIESLGYQVRDYGNIPCLSMEDVSFANPEPRQDERLRFLAPIKSNLLALKERVERVMQDGALPLIIGGDHSQAMGSVAGLQKSLGSRLGMLWVDAHGDFNTPATTPSGNIHGMPLAVISGRGDPDLLAIGPFPGCIEANIVILGARDLDSGEMDNLRNSAVTVFSTHDIMEQSFVTCMDKAVSIASSGVDHLHLSFDMDSIDPMFCPGTGTAVPGGLTNREVLYLMERVFETGKLCSIDLVEVNPALDFHNQTGEFAVELICRALGKKTCF
jgi:arginase